MFVITLDEMGDIRNCGLDIVSHYVDGSQVVQLRHAEHLRLLLIAILLTDGVDIRPRSGSHHCITRLSTFLLLPLFVGFDESHFSGNGEVGDRTVNNRLVKFILENVLLDGQRLLEIFYGQLAHVHDGSDVELIDPVGHLVHA